MTFNYAFVEFCKCYQKDLQKETWKETGLSQKLSWIHCVRYSPNTCTTKRNIATMLMWLNLLPWGLQLPTFLLITCPIISPLTKEKSWWCTSHIHQQYREQSSRNSRLTKYFQIFGQWSPAGLLIRTFFFVIHDSEIHQFSVFFPLLSHLLCHMQLTCHFPFSPRVFLPKESKVSHHSLPLISYLSQSPRKLSPGTHRPSWGLDLPRRPLTIGFLWFLL